MKILSKEEFEIEVNRIVTYGTNDIKIGIEDINQITKNKNLLVVSASEYSGNNPAQETIKSAILDFEKNNLSLKEADGILVYFQVNSDYEIMDISEAMEIINIKSKHEVMLEEPDVIWGISFDNNLKNNYVKATVFIGFSRKGKYGDSYIEKPVI